MTILTLSDGLSSKIATKVERINVYHQSDIDTYLKDDEDFQNVIDNAKKILGKNHYVIIKKTGFVREKAIFEAFVKQFGSFYGTVEYTDIKLDCHYTGCNYSALELHNDDAIDLENQPLYGFIQVQNEDPLKLTKNGVVKVDDIVSYLEVHDRELLKDLLNTCVSMLAYGVNYDGKDKKKIEVHEPVLYEKEGIYYVRFDLTRIKYYHWKKKQEQPSKQVTLIKDFLSIAKKLRKEIYLERSDIYIHNNKRTLHDRTECSIELNSDGSVNTREIFVSFVRE